MQRKKLSTTIGANNHAYLLKMVKAGKAESVGAAVDRAVELFQKPDPQGGHGGRRISRTP